MPNVLRVRPHPLGVVVSRQAEKLGELLLPGEKCFGVDYEELARVAETTGYVEIPDGDANDGPLTHY